MRNKKLRENTRQRKKTITRTRQYLRGSAILPISTELQGYYYYQGRIQSTTTAATIFSLYI